MARAPHRDVQPAAELVEEDLRFAAREVVEPRKSIAELAAPGYINSMGAAVSDVVDEPKVVADLGHAAQRSSRANWSLDEAVGRLRPI